MNKENANAAEGEELTVRITRGRARALRASGKVAPSKPSFKQDPKRVLRSHIKRAALDDNKPSVTSFACLQHKRRAVLRDVTNIYCKSSNAKDAAHLNCIDATKVKLTEQAGKCPAKYADEITDISMEISPIDEDDKARLAEELSKIRMGEEPEITSPKRLRKGKTKCHAARKRGAADLMLHRHDSMENNRLQRLNQGEKEICGTLETLSSLGITDIDLNQKDPQFCSFYVSDIYANVHVAELDQRPSINYMERLQHDITPSMRGILIDWLVEVSEEYKLVPDTLYLTVNLIDRFLSQNEIEKHRLQLLGVACMLIASKYEEFCAPRVEEFCFITDNTYTRGEVLKMESQVLSLLHFQLSVPTIKTFLRRFIQAAQVSQQVPCVELEFLANYLAELTLVDYNFLKFLPSLVAASSVFLARWMLNQSVHPWNPTLEHYTRYKACELKSTVLALEDLQLNTNGCSLNAIREKYGQQKLLPVFVSIDIKLTERKYDSDFSFPIISFS